MQETTGSSGGTNTEGMTMRVLTLLLALIVLTGSSARAEVLEYPLPGFTGDPMSYSPLHATVPYNGGPVQVNSVTIHLVGNLAALGTRHCNNLPPGQSETWPVGIYIQAGLQRNQVPLSHCDLYSGLIEQLGPIDQSMICYCQSNFNELVDGDVIDIDFYFMIDPFQPPAGKSCDNISIDGPTASLASVTLVIDVTTGVPTEHTTWSRIKALYR